MTVTLGLHYTSLGPLPGLISFSASCLPSLISANHGASLLLGIRELMAWMARCVPTAHSRPFWGI